MKSIGLIGGMSWESTVTYYQLLNRMARERLGGLHSAQMVLWSFDFAQIEEFQARGDWDAAAQAMIEAAQSVERAGAEMLLICTNTMHKTADQVHASIGIPLLHIADVTAEAILASGARRPLLLATAYTMEQDFYVGRLRELGVDVIIPAPKDRAVVHKVIYTELCQGIVSPASKAAYLEIIERAVASGADSVVFGCTEVGLLIRPEDLSVPAFDTTELHAAAAIELALG